MEQSLRDILDICNRRGRALHVRFFLQFYTFYATITKSVDEIIDMWNVDFINDSADKCPQLDVIQDGIINAKDYAKLNHIKNFGY